MDRTLRAAVTAALLGFVTVAGLGVFLGFPTTGSLVAGAVTGVLAGGLLLGAGRRAETFHPTDPNAHLADHPDPSDLPDPSDDPDPGATRG
ncbi:MAG: hypothetical protein ACNA8R_02175 [Nitriliruptoraceae bacterium]